MAKARSFLAAALGGAAGLATALTYRRYRQDIAEARRRALARCRLAQTACGTIEYATEGEGPPVLMVHGIVGGCDQGLMSARSLGGGLHWIVPSRFGYLRTPLPADPSPAAQADAYACLLDALGVREAGVVGTSAGGPSAIQFALRYPERCRALVLISTATYVPGTQPPSASTALEVLRNLALGSDFLMWAIMQVARPALLSFMGITPQVRARLTPQEQAWLGEFTQTLLPISARRAGILNDTRINEGTELYPLERITVPALVVNAADDPMGTFPGGQYTAQRIPGARFVAVESGGHMLLGHGQRLNAEITGFLRQHSGQGSLWQT